ncbi:MAG: sigma-70 family RNA polymerase sigma factor [Candidatus Wildermuthbacteria bacterium]|nr:sigma-70 family RNA polymerase sigma factor [Candidatus Wildermuthbacteria bacterium]
MSARRARQENRKASLVKQTKQDANHFGELYEQYFQRVFRYIAGRLGKGKEAAEDLAQDTFVRAFRGFSHFQDRGFSYLTYLLRVARNLLIDTYRTSKSIVSLEYFAQEPSDLKEDIHEKASVRMEVETLQKFMRKLKPKEREILSAFYLEERSLKEIARQTGKSVNAAKLMLSRARKRLAAMARTAMTPLPGFIVSTIRRGKEKQRQRAASAPQKRAEKQKGRA